MAGSVRRTVAWTLAGTACIAGIIVAGVHRGIPADTFQMLPGTAWLISSPADELTLLDGSTGQVSAQVRVRATDVVQQGPSAYAVDTATGTVRYIDGATTQISFAATPIPGATTGLRVYATARGFYAVDTVSGRVAVWTYSGNTMPSVPGATDPDNIAVDKDGRLWVFDAATGLLTSVDESGMVTGPLRVAEPERGAMVLVDGRPVVVEPDNSRVTTIEPDNTVGEHREIVGIVGRSTIVGSTDPGSIYQINNDEVSVCPLAGRSCAPPVALSDSGRRLGLPVAVGGRLFLPDPATGSVIVVEPAGRGIVASRKVLRHPGSIDLIAKDGLVFFNEPMGTRAGVIRPDGTVLDTDKHPPSLKPGLDFTPLWPRLPAAEGGEPGRFKIRNVSIEGNGNVLEVRKGGRYQIGFDLLHDCSLCGGAVNQVIVGLAGQERAQRVAWIGGQRSWNNRPGGHIFDLTDPAEWVRVSFPIMIPEKSGFYEIRARYAQDYSDGEEALGWWKVDRPEGPGSDATIATVLVES